MIMVTGASGALGSLITAGLAAEGADVTAGTRAPSALGAEVPARRVDFDAPETLRTAFEGVDVLVMVSAGYAEDDVVIARHRAAVDAAQAVGVRHVVYTGLAGAGDHLSLAVAHRATERMLMQSGLKWTILRNGLYAELFAAPEAAASGVLDAPMGSGSVAAVAREDLADIAVRVAREAADDRHAGKVYELVGEHAVGGADIAASLEAAAGQAVRYGPMSLGDFRERLTSAGLLQYQVTHAVSIHSNLAAGFLAGTDSDLKALLPHPAREALPIISGL